MKVVERWWCGNVRAARGEGGFRGGGGGGGYGDELHEGLPREFTAWLSS